MKTLRVSIATALVAAFAMLAPSSAQAQGYQNVTVTVSDHELVGGNPVTITATVDPSSTDCEWELEYDGVTATGSGNSITHTFDTDVVDSTRHDTSFATCTYQDASVSSAATASGTGEVILHPRGGDNDDDDNGDGDGDGDDDDDNGNGGGGDGDGGGLLPNTGGERLAWLLIGLLLVVVGTGVVLASRERDA